MNFTPEIDCYYFYKQLTTDAVVWSATKAFGILNTLIGQI